jgi:hypothetical protein
MEAFDNWVKSILKGPMLIIERLQRGNLDICEGDGKGADGTGTSTSRTLDDYYYNKKTQRTSNTVSGKASNSGVLDAYEYNKKTQGAGEDEEFDTEVRTEIMSISVLANHNIVFNGHNTTWDYIGIDVLNFLKTTENAATRLRSKADIDAFNSTYQPTLDKIQHNRSLNLNAQQLEYLFLVDPEGVRDYLYGKSEELINDVYRRLTGKEPVYYEKTLTGWEITSRLPGTTGDIFSEVMSDAHVLLVRKDGMPHDLISLVLPVALVGLTFIGLNEMSIVAEGISTFGVRNAIAMYTNGTLASTIAFQREINGATNAVEIADEVVNLAEGTWEEGCCVRGDIIDEARGNGLGHNFPVIDKLEGQDAVSIKSIDTAAATYQNGSKLLSKLKVFVNQLIKFHGANYNGVTAYEGVQFTSKSLELVIPDVQLSAQQMQAIIDAKAYAQSLGIDFKIVVGR